MPGPASLGAGKGATSGVTAGQPQSGGNGNNGAGKGGSPVTTTKSASEAQKFGSKGFRALTKLKSQQVTISGVPHQHYRLRHQVLYRTAVCRTQ
jgi:hypothetical protein